MELKKSTIIECVASTSDKDVVGESLDISGADITPLIEGRGFVNSDHRNDFAHLVGRVQDAKIIKALNDCTTPTQIKYWNELKKPFIWTKAEIWDGHGHKEADSIASIYNFYNTKGEAPPVKVSVEGKTLERGENGVLKRTLIKGIALTVAPCNRATRSEVVQITKSIGVDSDSLFKSEAAEIPTFIEVTEADRFQKLMHLAVTARELLRDVVRKSETNKTQRKFSLRSPELFKRVKETTALLRNKKR